LVTVKGGKNSKKKTVAAACLSAGTSAAVSCWASLPLLPAGDAAFLLLAREGVSVPGRASQK